MKIKLLILDKDKSYLNRIASVFYTKYPDKFEIYTFTEQENAILALDTNKVDVFVASDAFDIDVRLIPRRCGFAYFVDSADVDTVKEQRAICRFQKVDLIYKQILSIYSENFGNTSGLKISDANAKVIIYTSPSGGTGNSSVAAACAIHYAIQGKKTLYLNLEKFGSSDSYFAAEGLFGMTDIIYALKSKKANLAMKLESCVKQDVSGVYFYSQPKIALDILELGIEDVIRLISELKITGSYEYIIVDTDFGMDKDKIRLFKQAHALIWVGDGSEVSNGKVASAYNALNVMEQNAEEPLSNRLALIYNKFSNKTSVAMEDLGIRIIGGTPVYMHAGIKQVVMQIATMDMFDKIFG